MPPEEKKDSNRYHADHISVKLRATGYDDREPVETLESKLNNKDILSLLARMEHRCWTAELLLAGWRYAPEKDDVRRTHPFLVPFDKLPESEKEKNYIAVQNIPIILRSPSWGEYRKFISSE